MTVSIAVSAAPESTWLREVLVSIPAWAGVLLLFLIFLAVSLGSRAFVIRRCTESRREELAGHASSLVTGTAASFGFFVGFAITMTWGAVSAGQAAVETQAAHAQQLAWTVQNISDQAASDQIIGNLHSYLTAAAVQDGPYLEVGDTLELPSAQPLDVLQSAVHGYAFGPNSADPEVSGLVSAAADLTESAAAVAAVAQRSLPPLVAVLLFVTAVLLAAIMGISNATTARPWLLGVWCLIPALAIVVIPGPGGIGIDLSPLRLVAERIVS